VETSPPLVGVGDLAHYVRAPIDLRNQIAGSREQ